MCYFVYYVLGYIAFPYMNKLIKDTSLKAKFWKKVIAVGAVVYTGIIFIGRDLLGWLRHIPVIATFRYMITTIIVIVFFIVVALVLEEFEILQQIGRDTLFLCGSEFMIKTCIDYFFTNLGFTIQFTTPLSVYIWAGLVLVVAVKWIIPVEKAIFKKLRLI